MSKVPFVLACAMSALPAAAIAFGELDPAFNPAPIGRDCSASFLVPGDQGLIYGVDGLRLARVRADGTTDTRWGEGGIAALPVTLANLLPVTLFHAPDGGI